MFMQECRLTILVNWRREVWGELGYYPSCSLPMRMGRAGAEKTDCFAALVISAETYSGMFFICAEAAARPSSSRTELWSGSLLKGLRRQWPKTARTDSPRHFTTSFSLLCPPPSLFFFFTAAGITCSQVFPHHRRKRNSKTRLSLPLLLSVLKSWPQSQGF